MNAPTPVSSRLAAGSLRSRQRTIAMLVTTPLMAVVLVAGPSALGWWAARSWERSGYLFIDLVVAVAVVSSLVGWVRILRPEAAVKRIAVVPVSVQRTGRCVLERSAFGVGAMSGWTSVEPDFGLTLVSAPRSTRETEWEDSWFARRMSAVDAPVDAGRNRRAAVPPRSAAAPALAEFDSLVVHVTSRGDSFWSLAEEKLGDATRWAELRDVNVGREVAAGVVLSNTDGLIAGYRILVPTTEKRREVT